MRTMLRIQIPTQRGNEAIADGTMPKTMQEVFDHVHPEAVYFTLNEGCRTAYVVFDMTDASEMPVIGEPLFMRLGATIDFSPVMTQPDLESGLGRAAIHP